MQMTTEKSRYAQIREIGKADDAVRAMMEAFLLANNWQHNKGRWSKKFDGKWRDVISVRVAFNVEIHSDLRDEYATK